MAHGRSLRLAPEWDRRFTRGVGVSAVAHVVAFALLIFFVTRSPPPPLPLVAYTVEITDPSALGGRLPPGAPGKDMSGGDTRPAPPEPPAAPAAEAAQKSTLPEQVAKAPPPVEEASPPVTTPPATTPPPTTPPPTTPPPTTPPPTTPPPTTPAPTTPPATTPPPTTPPATTPPPTTPQPPPTIAAKEPPPLADKKVEPPKPEPPKTPPTTVPPKVETPPKPAPTASKPETKPETKPVPKPAEPPKPGAKPGNGKAGATGTAGDAPKDAYAAAAERWRSHSGGGIGGNRDGSGPIGTGGEGPGGGGQLVGMEFLAYTQRVISTVKSHWTNVIVRPGLVAVVRFVIAPDGEVSDIRLAQSSNNAAYDASVLRAVQQVGQLPPPPSRYVDTFRDFQIEFHSEETGGRGAG